MAKRKSSKKRRRHRKARVGNGPIGRIEITARGYAFVDTDEGSFYISANRLGGALPRDLVELIPAQTRPEQGKGALPRLRACASGQANTSSASLSLATLWRWWSPRICASGTTCS